MGMNITKLQPVGGFCAETAGAVGAVRRQRAGHPGLDHAHDHGRDRRLGGQRHAQLSAVKWGVAGRIVWAWVLTMPAAGMVAALCWFVVHFAGMR